MEKLTLVDNNVGIFPMIIGPAALDHAYQNKKVTISKSLVVGKSSVFDCANDKMDFSLPYVNLRRTFDKSWRIETKGRTGISISIFSSGPNNAPEKPFAGIMAYNAIAGFTTITGKPVSGLSDNFYCERREAYTMCRFFISCSQWRI